MDSNIYIIHSSKQIRLFIFIRSQVYFRMKISELKEYKKVNRPSRDELGKRIYEEIEFEKPYDPTDKSLNRRLFSKIIDLLFAIIIQTSLSNIGLINTENLLFDILIIIVLTVLISTIMEMLFGSSLGKLIFNLEVINDDCEHLSLKKSLFKNVYSLPIILFFLFSHGVVEFSDYYTNWLKRNSIYIIRRKEKSVIIQMMENTT